MTPALLTPSRPALAPIEDATRREFITGIGAAALAAAFLAACGEEDDDGAESGTRDFEDATGAIVKVPARPQRVVAVGPPQWGGVQVLSLGVPVVGMSNFDGSNWPDYVFRYFDLAEVQALGWAEETDVEAIAALEPDLIVAPAREGALDETVGVDPELLREIAPLAAIDPNRPIDEVMADYVRLLGVDEEVLVDQREEYETVIDEIRDVLGDQWSAVTVSSLWAGGDAAEAWGRQALPMNTILDSLGVQWSPPTIQAEEEGGYLAYSFERLAEFECDLMLYGNTYGDLRGNPLFDSLEVVKAGQLIEFPDFTFDGTHYANYTACAQHILAALQQIGEVRTDIV